MENPFEILLEKLTSIENRLIDIEAKLGVRKKNTKNKIPMITEQEAEEFIFKNVFNIDINKQKRS